VRKKKKKKKMQDQRKDKKQACDLPKAVAINESELHSTALYSLYIGTPSML
jgi:hypothetical protein